MSSTDQGTTQPNEPRAEKVEQAESIIGDGSNDAVQYQDFEFGDGNAAKKGDKVKVQFVGKLENGELFDSSANGRKVGDCFSR